MVGADILRASDEPDEPDDGPDAELIEDDDSQPVPARAAGARVTMVKEEVRLHRGPLPDPETLEAYKRIDPRFPEAILDSFKQQTSHRQDMERKLLTGSEKRADRGQWLGTGLLAAGLGGGIWVTLAGQPGVGTTMVLCSLAVGALSYVFGDYRKKD